MGITEKFGAVQESETKRLAGRGALKELEEEAVKLKRSESGELEESRELHEIVKGLIVGGQRFDTEVGAEVATEAIIQLMIRRERESFNRGAEAADYDELTSLYNRRAFDRDIGRIVERLQRKFDYHKASDEERRGTEPDISGGLAILMVDLDHFKQINDTYGHAAGDAALKAAAGALKEHLRGDEDFVARYGGEEFVIALRSYSPSARLAVAEKIRQAIETTEVIYEGNRIALTGSIGASRWHHSDTLDAVIARADGALYQAKRAGRNRIEDAEEPLDANQDRPPKS
jgi:diguanylate cyclase (GGDEF)-like protein